MFLFHTPVILENKENVCTSFFLLFIHPFSRFHNFSCCCFFFRTMPLAILVSLLLSINEDTMFWSVQRYLINLSLIFVTECRLSLSKMPGTPSSTGKWRSELSLFIEAKKARAAQRWSTFLEKSWDTHGYNSFSLQY